MNGSLNKALKDVNSFAVFVAVFMVLMSILTVFSDSFGMIGFIFMFGGLMPVTYIEQDRQKGWETYERMLPVSSAQVIGSKFILSLICMGLFYVCAVVGHITGGVICKNAGGKLDLPKPEDITVIDADFFKLLSFVSLISLAVAGILTMIIYRFRSNIFLRLGMSTICIIAGLCTSLLVSNDDEFTGPLSEISAGVLTVTFIVCTAVFIASYFLSLSLYNKYKD